MNTSTIFQRMQTVLKAGEIIAKKNEKIAEMNVKRSRDMRALVDQIESLYGLVKPAVSVNMTIVRCNGNGNPSTFNLRDLNKHLTPHK